MYIQMNSLLIPSSNTLLVPVTLEDVRTPVQRMRLFGGLLVLLVELDGLVRFGGDQSSAAHVEAHREDAVLRVDTARLRRDLGALEIVAGLPVPEEHRAVVAARDEHIVRVARQAVDDRIVALQILYELAVLVLPLLDVVRRTRNEHLARMVQIQCTNALLVVGERAHRFVGSNVPAAQSAVVRSGDDLRLHRLRSHARDRVRMAGQETDLFLGALEREREFSIS